MKFYQLRNLSEQGLKLVKELKFFILERERETDSMSRGGAEQERNTESEASFRL